jgi:hypothetical protein
LVFNQSVVFNASPGSEAAETMAPFPDVQTYPNPTQDILQIDVGQENLSASVAVMNNVGEVVLREESLIHSTYQLDMTDLKPGTYYVKVYTNGLAVTKRIVKMP